MFHRLSKTTLIWLWCEYITIQQYECKLQGILIDHQKCFSSLTLRDTYFTKDYRRVPLIIDFREFFFGTFHLGIGSLFCCNNSEIPSSKPTTPRASKSNCSIRHLRISEIQTGIFAQMDHALEIQWLPAEFAPGSTTRLRWPSNVPPLASWDS